MKRVDVSIVMGSDSDLPTMTLAGETLKKFGVSFEIRILSAHRSPDDTARYAKSLSKRGVKVVIAGAGCAAHLAGVIASNTILPVIGVPMKSSALNGIDALLSTVQMPSGVPVATMAIGDAGAKNAALFALQMLALKDPKLEKKLSGFKHKLLEDVRRKDRKSYITFS
ncbi:MAG: 5-(carboxyamino)imidazole ribonucleotide mutase [Candidatus Omnitrophica bacterium]|nr:5-(carboxyamino)imidazole ribonucleotide mutase [Candidatus Omnitrophota bacterium]